VKFDTVGTPIPETEVKITEEGRSFQEPLGLLGYYKNEEATQEDPCGRVALFRRQGLYR
jgi:long-chain acyl-CoA synthetase